MRAWGRLLRLSLAPTAAADIAAGVLYGSGLWPAGREPFLLIAASLCVYHGGMALNDWADRNEDARARADRPIPSGSVSAGAALALALALLAGGPLLAAAADARAAMIVGTVAVLAVVYDLAGRGPWLGPFLLGACRGGNLLAGISLGLSLSPTEALRPESTWLVPACYAAYVFTVSRLGRLEDMRDERAIGGKPALLLRIAAVLLAGSSFAARTPGSSARSTADLDPARWAELVALVALLLFATRAPLAEARRPHWTRADVVRAMGVCLRRLLVFTAAVALAVGGRDGWLVAGAILAGYPISYWLRGVFPPS